MHSLIKGRINFYTSNNQFYNLIRNIHRLEKGLTMIPRKSVYAISYIEETITLFNRIVKNNDKNKINQLIWANDVIDEYFGNVEHKSSIKKAYIKYKNINFRSKYNIPQMVPFLRNKNINDHVDR